MKEDIIGEVARPLWILLGTVFCVLLIACANVANLMLIRADGRRREIAVRSALGARRSWLIRSQLVEARRARRHRRRARRPPRRGRRAGADPAGAVDDSAAQRGVAGPARAPRRRRGDDDLGADLRPGAGIPLHAGVECRGDAARRARIDRESIAATRPQAARRAADGADAGAARRLRTAGAELLADAVDGSRLQSGGRDDVPPRRCPQSGYNDAAAMSAFERRLFERLANDSGRGSRRLGRRTCRSRRRRRARRSSSTASPCSRVSCRR